MPTIRAFFDPSKLTLTPTGPSGNSFTLAIKVQEQNVTLRVEFNGRFYITLDSVSPCVPEPLSKLVQEIVFHEDLVSRSVSCSSLRPGAYRSKSGKTQAELTEYGCAGTIGLSLVVRAKSLSAALDFRRQVMSGRARCFSPYGKRDEGAGPLRRRQPEIH